MNIKKSLYLRIKDIIFRVFIKRLIYDIKKYVNQVKKRAPFPIIIILYFILGLILSNYHFDIPKWISAGAAVFSTWIAYSGLKFAKSIFDRNYDITSTLGCTDNNKIMIIISAVNKSRISTCIKFLGIIINTTDLIYDDREIAVIHAFPDITSTNSSNGYKKYVGVFTNISAYNSFNFKIPYNDILKFMKNYWSDNISKALNNNNPITLFFVFEDYRRKVYIRTMTINPDTISYNKIKNMFISNNEIEA